MADMDKHVAHAVLIFAGVLRPDSQEETVTEKERIDTVEVDNFIYRFQYADGSAFQIYEDGRCIKLSKGSMEGDEEYGAIINRIPTRIAQAAALGYQEGVAHEEALLAAVKIHQRDTLKLINELKLELYPVTGEPK